MFKITLSIVLIFSAFGILSQEVPQEPVPTNNNSNVYNNSYELNNQLEETKQVDTAMVVQDKEQELKKSESQSVRPQRKLKSATTRSIEAVPATEMAPEMEEEPASSGTALEDADFEGASQVNTQSARYMQANYDFTISKGQATTQPMQRTPLPEHQLQMNEAVNYFEQNAPNSFEYHYFKYTAGNYNVSEVGHLREAEKIMPGNSDVHTQLAAYNIITQDADSAELYVDKLLNSGRLNANTLHYAQDLLISVPQNGVLITHGFDDTYSTFKKQQADGVREDVTLISLDFLQSEAYREQLLAEGFKLPEKQVIDVAYLAQFCALNAEKPISISMTTPKEYFLPIQQHLFVAGLVFEYHEGDYNNFERNDELWNSELSKYLVENAVDEKSKQLSANYLPMLLQLRNVYGQQGEIKKLKEIDEAIDKVSLQCKKYDQVQKLKSSY